MPSSFTRQQLLENRTFLKALRRTGNTRQAARDIGVVVSTMFWRRRHNPAFAQDWDAAIAVAHARLGRGEGPPAPRGAGGAGDYKTQGGEPTVVYRAGGRLQIRAAHPGAVTQACEQAFLAALSATANIRLSAAAAGISYATVYRRRRRSPAFAREMRLALEMGYERIEMALLASYSPTAHNDDAWRSNEPPPIPSMTANQALQLLHLHHKTTQLWAEAPYMRRRRGETAEQWSRRRGADYTAQLARDAEDRVLQAVLRNTAWEAAHSSPHAPDAPKLPALDQVTGWSKADPAKQPHDPTRALFGGWRLKDWKG